MSKFIVSAFVALFVVFSFAAPAAAATSGRHITEAGMWVPDHCDTSAATHKLFMPMMSNAAPADVNTVQPGSRSGGCVEQPVFKPAPVLGGPCDINACPLKDESK